MKMNTKPMLNLEVCLEELVNAFSRLPGNQDGQAHHHSIKFPVTNDYGNICERELLFTWNPTDKDWELDTRGHDLVITSSPR